MRRVLPIVALGIVICFAGSAAGAEPEETTASVRIVGPSDEQQAARVDHAVALFAEVGLALPETEIRFLGPDDCKGHMGLFSPGESRITVCSEAEFLITHELAHAWIREHVSDEQREDYLLLRGLSTWASRSASWKERGTEDAAFVMQQILMMGPNAPTTPEWESRKAAFELLTGM